ncbi:MAG: hypothetical protein ABEJ31_03660 [Haloarculaceae archaeon]
MATYEIETPDGPERGVRVGCREHDEWAEFQPGYRTVAFACDGCGTGVEVSLHDLTDWRDWGERC